MSNKKYSNHPLERKRTTKYITMKDVTTSFTWDWKKCPNWNEINKFIDGLNARPYFYGILTDSDDWGVVVSTKELTIKEAQNVYNILSKL